MVSGIIGGTQQKHQKVMLFPEQSESDPKGKIQGSRKKTKIEKRCSWGGQQIRERECERTGSC